MKKGMERTLEGTWKGRSPNKRSKKTTCCLCQGSQRQDRQVLTALVSIDVFQQVCFV